MKTIAIGDIHGCFDELIELVKIIRKEVEGDKRWVFLGDYVDRGPKIRETVQYLMEWQWRDDENKIICLKGNHEDMLLKGKMLWLVNGGAQTIKSYDVPGMVGIPGEHRKWMDELPVFYIDPTCPSRVFVHAGIQRGKTMEEQIPVDMMWIREEFLYNETSDGLYVVHGHTPIMKKLPQVMPTRCNVDTGCCFGGVLSAAVFDERQYEPYLLFNHQGMKVSR